MKLLITVVICSSMFFSCKKITVTENPITKVEPIYSGYLPNESIIVENETRNYSVYIPRSLPKRPTVVLAFHGHYGDMANMASTTKFNEVAEKEGYLIVYPNALDKQWSYSKKEKDLKFVEKLIGLIKTKYKPNESNIFIMGMSNGGYFSHQIGQFQSNKIAGVIAHSASLGDEVKTGIKAEKKFPVMIIHGDRDNLVSVIAARNSRSLYLKEEHKVIYREIAGLGHEWGTQADINTEIVSFIKTYSF